MVCCKDEIVAFLFAQFELFPCPRNLSFKKVFNKTWFITAEMAVSDYCCIGLDMAKGRHAQTFSEGFLMKGNSYMWNSICSMYIVEPFFWRNTAFGVQLCKEPDALFLPNFWTITLLANVWSQSLKDICCIHVYTLVINDFLGHSNAPCSTLLVLELFISQGDQLCATYSLQTGRETTSLEAKPKDNILHQLGKLKYCT